VCILKHMRLHILLEDALVTELDARVGPGRRSAFVAALIRAALDDARRWDDIEQGFGSIADGGHEWDADPAAWVRDQRRADKTRVG